MQNLLELIKCGNLPLIYQDYTTEQIVKELSFKESMFLAYQMFCNKKYDDHLYNFAVDLLQYIRQKYEQDWKSDWRNDLFLGDACQFTMKFNESYEAYKRACLEFNTSNLPLTLLVSLAGCYLTPNKPISIEDVEKLAKTALEKEKSIEAVVLIRGICKTQGRAEEFAYWSNILEELEKKGAYMKSEWPKWLMNGS